MPPLVTIARSRSAGIPLRRATLATIAVRSSGMPEDGAYRVWFRASARVIASLIGCGVGM